MFLDYQDPLTYERVLESLFPVDRRGWGFDYEEQEDVFFEKANENLLVQCWFKSRRENEKIYILLTSCLYGKGIDPKPINFTQLIEFGGVVKDAWLEVSLEEFTKIRGLMIHILDYPFNCDFEKYVLSYDFGLGLCIY